MSIETKLDELGSVFDEAKPFPLSNKVMIDLDTVRGILDEIRLNMPEELLKARQIASERRDILNEAQNDADVLISKAEDKARGMIEEHEITAGARNAANEIMQNARVQASELMETTRREANDIMEQAHKWATDIRTSAGEYVEEIIRTSDEALAESLNEVRKARQQLRVAASRKTEPRPDVG